MTATRDFLEATSNEFNQAVIRAKEAVTAQKSARIATKSLQVLEDAWTKYNTAYAQYAAKLKEPATKAEAQGIWLGEMRSYEVALDALEEYLEDQQGEPRSAQGDTAVLLAKEAVAAAAQEALRRQGSLDAQLSKELNTNQVAFLQQEVARMREDLGNNLEAAYARLIEASADEDKVKVAKEKAAELADVNRKLDESLVALSQQVREEERAADGTRTEDIAESVTAAVTASMEAMRQQARDEGHAAAPGADTIAESVAAAVTASMEAMTLRAERNSAPRYQAYAKESFPKFEGELRKYPAWKKEMQELVLPGMEVVRQIRLLDKQSPAEVDLQTCTTVAEAWRELDTRFGNRVNISNALMDDFVGHKLRGISDESRVVELKQVVMKLYTDLKAVGCEDNLEANPFILNKVVARLPRFWQNKYSENKTELLRAAAASASPQWTAVSEFLKSEALRIETDMPSSLDCNSQGSGRKQVVNALRQNNQGSRRGPPSEEIPCPECNVVHTYVFRRGPQSGKRVNSDRFSNCPKFQQADANGKAQLLEKHGACSQCTVYSHDKANCWFPVKECGISGCKLKHHPTLHGSTVAYVNTLRVNNVENKDQEVFLHVVPHEMEGDRYNIFLDDGSDCSLISVKAAKRMGLRGRKEICYMQRCGDEEPTEELRTMYKVRLTTNLGEVVEVVCIEVETITSTFEYRDVGPAYALFPHVPAGALEAAVGEVDIMIGQDHSALLATGGEGLNVCDNLRAMRCKFGSGWVLGGWHEKLSGGTAAVDRRVNLLRGLQRVANPKKINYVQCSSYSAVHFLSDDLQDLSSQLPRVCQACKSCNRCRHETLEVSRVEKEELRMIQDNVTLDEVNQVCNARYPVIKDTSAFKNNQWQAEKMAASLEKRLAKREGGREEYNQEVQDFLDRKVIRVVTQEEIRAWELKGGKVNFVSHHAVERPDKATTKLRLVSNSSLKNSGRGPSPNSVWPKGPFGGGLQPLHEVLLRFRSYEVALHSDLTKMFHSVRTGPEEMFMRLMVWRATENDDWVVYGFLVVTFGDRPATCITSHCLNLAAEAGRLLDPKAALCLQNDIYCDDICTGGSKDDVSRMVGQVSESADGKLAYSGTLSQILSKAGFAVKMMVTSGERDDRALDRMGGNVLGIKWEPRSDIFIFKPEVHLGKKLRNGLFSGPQLTPENLKLLDNFTWTRRLVLSTVASIYDPAGLISPILIKFKLFLRDLCQSGHEGWDAPLKGDFLQRWKSLVVEVVMMQPIKVNRTVKPSNAVGAPALVTLVDGSVLAYACAVYVVYKITVEEAGPWSSHLGQKFSRHAALLVSKARVAPLAGLTAPRSEMNSLVLAARLNTLVLRSLSERPDCLTILGDSECCIAAVESEGGRLAPYLANRRAELLETFESWKGAYPELEVRPLHHVPGTLNTADLATRGTATGPLVTEGSDWQCGPEFLTLDFEEWPVTRKIKREIPEEELLKKERFRLVNHLMLKKQSCDCRVCSLFATLRKILHYSNVKSKVEGILARLLRLSAHLAAKPAGSPRPTESEAKAIMRDPPLHPDELQKSKDIMLKLSQPEVEEMFQRPPSGKRKSTKPHKNRRGAVQSKAETLQRKVLNLSSLLPTKADGIWWTQGRFGKELARVLGPSKLAILPSSSRLAYLIMEESHREFHMGGGDTCFRSRSRAWIVHARPLADRVAADCLKCRLELKNMSEQRMGLLPLERTDVFSRPFTNTAIDLLGSYKVKAMNNARSFLKVWPVVFTCMSVGALHIEVSSSYGADSFLVSFKAFTAVRGRPARVYTDLGSQLVKAANYAGNEEDPANWNWRKIEEVEGRQGTEFRFCPAATAWRNGMAEQRVCGLKKGLDLLMVSGAQSLNYSEFVSLLRSCANLINDRPLGVRHHNKGVEGELLPLTPNLLLLGKTSTGDLDSTAMEDKEDKFTRRAALVDKLEREWWQMWYTQCFDSLFPFPKWRHAMQNLKVGDIVLFGSDNKVGKGDYRLARVCDVNLDDDGLARDVIVEYRPRRGAKGLPYTSKNLEKKKLPIQRLVLIQPIEAGTVIDKSQE